ncbi:MAG: hypothetical protein II453_14280 [Alphaproteobacteria bacterium]|nr:hypothetical protein [Alphaproteobacteria bacterium]
MKCIINSFVIQKYSMGFEEFSHVYSDRYESYREACPKSNLNNGQQLHWLATFRRRSIVVIRSLENLVISMVLFARFYINGSIDELIALLK